MLEDAIQRSDISISHGNSIVSLFQAGDRSNNVLLWKMLLQLIWKVAPRWSWPQDYLLLASYKYLPSIYIIYTGIAPSKKKKKEYWWFLQIVNDHLRNIVHLFIYWFHMNCNYLIMQACFHVRWWFKRNTRFL